MERILGAVESNRFSPEHVEEVIEEVLRKSLVEISSSSLADLCPWQPELSIALSSDEPIRPALHFSDALLSKLAESGASIDFDPYV